MKRINQVKPLAAGLLLMIALTHYTSPLVARNPNPVSWTFIARQISPTLFEITTIARLSEGWRFRGQTPMEALPSLGRFMFFKHDNVLECRTAGVSRFIGKATGNGLAGDTLRPYEKAIQLVVLVRLKEPVDTNLTGEVVYSLTNDLQRSMLKDKINFTVLLR